MKPPPFDYLVPDTLDEALAALREHGDDAQPLAGGQSLAPMLALRVARPRVLVDINRIAALGGVHETRHGVRLGATTRQVTILRDAAVASRLPALAETTRFIGHYQTRNRGTIGGSISLADPAAELPAFALAMDAELELRSVDGGRTVTARDFFVGPYTTARRPDELLTSITFEPTRDDRIGVDEIARRPGDFAMTGMVARLVIRRGRIREAALAWFGMGSQPIRASRAETALAGSKLKAVDIMAIAQAAVAETEPPTDGHATADYRRAAGRTLAARLLTNLLSKEGDS